jgi:chitinase
MNLSRAKWALFVVVILAGLTTFRSSFGDSEPKPRTKVFVGYLYGQPPDVHFPLYTHICHAFLVADGEGKVKPSRIVPSKKLTNDAHLAGVKVMVSLGG